MVRLCSKSSRSYSGRPVVASRRKRRERCSAILAPKLSSVDLQFLENRKLSRAEICTAFGVPEEIVTTTDHNKYDVMQGARLNFIENRIAPLCARLEAMEDITVKTIDPTAVGWFDLDALPIMQQARRNRLAAAKTGFDMGIPFNELNRVLDLGFKNFPWGDTRSSRPNIPLSYRRLHHPRPRITPPRPLSHCSHRRPQDSHCHARPPIHDD